MLLGLRCSDCEEGLEMDLGCQVGNSEWHLVGLPKDGREVGATGKHVDLGLRGRQALTLPAPSHDSRESVGGLPFPPSPCHGHDMAFFLDQNGYFPLSNLNCVGQGGDRRRLFRRGSACLSKNSHTQFVFSATPPSSSLAIFVPRHLFSLPPDSHRFQSNILDSFDHQYPSSTRFA